MIICYFYYDNDKLLPLTENAVNSFKEHHPEIEVKVIGPDESTNKFSKYNTGIARFAAIYSHAVGHGATKVISLGIDTLTLSPLVEFINNNEDDIIVSLDHVGAFLKQNKFFAPPDLHYNCDVVCFNNMYAIKELIKESMKFIEPDIQTGHIYADQGGLTSLVAYNKYTHNVVDGPENDVYYNARVKQSTRNRISPERANSFKVKDGMIYTPEGKIIRVYHYCEGLGSKSDLEIKEIVERVHSLFGEDVKRFLADKCNIKNYIEEV